MANKLKFSDENIENAVRDLGGNQEDLDLVADADFSGSDFEDVSPVDAKGLDDEVQKMWAQLSGEPVETTTSSKKSKNIPKDSKDTNSKANSNTTVEVKPKKNAHNNTKSNTTSETTSKKPSNDGPKRSSRDTSVMKPAVPAMSKKTKIQWEKYLASLTHPADKLLIDSQKWDVERPQQGDVLPTEIVTELKQKATQCLTTENEVYFKQRTADREFSSSLEFLKSGTFYDQLGTLSILSTESPLHSVRFLESLGSKCEIKHRESACKALEVTKDLLVSHVMPDRRLRAFTDQPLTLNLPITTLMSYAFEDYLKKFFFRLLQTMERLLSDTVENIRLRSLHCVFDFFRQKPEQEANLLRLGLNKLGDPAGKVASRVKRLVMDALQMHPGMKPIVATAVSEVLGRVHDYRTRYYAIDMLSEFILSNRDPALPNQLIYIYLDLFERLLGESSSKKDERITKSTPSSAARKGGKRFRPKRGKKGGIKQDKLDETEVEQQQHARLVAKIFTGLNRAFPFSKLEPAVFKKYIDTLYYMSHSPNVGTFIEALCFIFQLANASPKGGESGNRYYRALYESLWDHRLQASSKLAKYIHLLLKSLSVLVKERDAAQTAAFIKRILQIACSWSEVGAVASLVHTAHISSVDCDLIDNVNSDENKEYDYKQRDPRYAHAENSNAWELVLLQRHYHPTVAHYANNYLAPKSDKVALDMPDIEQYTINSFLSKWSYKNPKTKDTTRGGSIFQPLSGFTDLTLGVRQEKRNDNIPASLQNWKNKSKSDVAPDDQFLYEYFSQRPDRVSKTKATPTENDDSDAESIADDEINEAMAQAGPGDLGGNEIETMEFSDSEDDGDLEADLEAAFKSDEDDEDEEAEGESDELQDSGTDHNNRDMELIDDNDSNIDHTDDFADFDGEMSVQKETSSDKGKKRKRWATYPTFLDADQFEQMYAEETPAKKRQT